jgi:hypothetical protein
LEAAIGIEPMNKGFADHLGQLSPTTTEYYIHRKWSLEGFASNSVCLSGSPW